MAHVELSLSDPFALSATQRGVRQPAPPVPTALQRWITAVTGAPEPCLVVDGLSVILAASPSACRMLGFGRPADAVGRSLFAGLLHLLDFTTPGAALADGELEKIPPVLAYSSGSLARGLLRVQSGAGVITVDAVATPLLDGDAVVGSLTFFAQI